MTVVELFGLALYGYEMAGALLLLVVFASVNQLAAARLGSDCRPVSPPGARTDRRKCGPAHRGQGYGEDVRRAGARRTLEKKRLPAGGRFFAWEKPTCYKLRSTEQDSRH